MRLFLLYFIFLALNFKAQDKLYYTNGKVREGIIVSIGKDMVFYKENDTSLVERIAVSELLLTENYKGIRHIFGTDNKAAPKTATGSDLTKSQALAAKGLINSLGIQPFGIFFGRACIVYERLNEQRTIGVALPLILTYDPQGLFIPSGSDSTSTPYIRSKELNFIGGLDVNFYLTNKQNSRFFMGPRFRYGTNLAFAKLEYYTLQTQMGWRFGRAQDRISQHLSLGYGFAQVISFATTTRNIRKYYGMFSFTYRINFNW
jgi:hypothetical protein